MRYHSVAIVHVSYLVHGRYSKDNICTPVYTWYGIDVLGKRGTAVVSHRPRWRDMVDLDGCFRFLKKDNRTHQATCYGKCVLGPETVTPLRIYRRTAWHSLRFRLATFQDAILILVRSVFSLRIRAAYVGTTIKEYVLSVQLI